MKKVILQNAKTSNVKIFFESVANAILIIISVLIICVFFYLSTHSLQRIEGHSMEPGIANEGQLCFVHDNSSFTYGDLVVAHKNQQTDIIKRVIALSGDKIGFKLNTTPEEQGFSTPYYQVVLIKSGQSTPTYLNEAYLYQGITDIDTQNQLLCNTETSYNKFKTLPNLQDVVVDGEMIKMLTIKQNYVFLLGDNRAVSEDCSHYGAISMNQVQGRVDQVFWNTEPPFWVAFKAVIGLNT